MRVIRVLVYEGDAKVIAETMKRNNVKIFHEIAGMQIFETMVGYMYPTSTGDGAAPYNAVPDAATP